MNDRKSEQTFPMNQSGCYRPHVLTALDILVVDTVSGMFTVLIDDRVRGKLWPSLFFHGQLVWASLHCLHSEKNCETKMAVQNVRAS